MYVCEFSVVLECVFSVVCVCVGKGIDKGFGIDVVYAHTY